MKWNEAVDEIADRRIGATLHDAGEPIEACANEAQERGWLERDDWWAWYLAAPDETE